MLEEASGGVSVGGKIQGAPQSEESVRKDFREPLDIVCHLACLGIIERCGSVLRRVGCLIESPF